MLHYNAESLSQHNKNLLLLYSHQFEVNTFHFIPGFPIDKKIECTQVPEDAAVLFPSLDKCVMFQFLEK